MPQTGLGNTHAVAPVANCNGWVAMFDTHHPLKSRLNDVALLNIETIPADVTFPVSHAPMSELNAVARPNIVLILETFVVFQAEILPLNAEADWNIPLIVVTLLVFQVLTLPLNAEAN